MRRDAMRCDAMRCDAKKQQVPRCARDDSRVVLTGEGTIQTGVGTSCIVPLQTKNESKSGEASSPLHEKAATLGDGDVGAEVDVLDGVEELDAFFHGALEGFAAGDEAGAAGALVDDGGGYGFFEIVGAGSAAAVDQTRPAPLAVGHLVAAQVDRVVAREFGVDAL